MDVSAIRKSVGMADGCELLSCAFAFPSEALAKGLSDGSVMEDARSCLLDAGVADGVGASAVEGLGTWAGFDVAELYVGMRRVYSLLYLKPGSDTPVFPYESAFIHVQRGLPGAPALFRTAITLDVERQMHKAGVAAKDERTEPCDSVFEEFEFLSYLFARQADALQRDDREQARDWGERTHRFAREHALAWMPAFMERTRELAPESPYAALAAVALALLEVLGRE